jgi:hypothetical protein
LLRRVVTKRISLAEQSANLQGSFDCVAASHSRSIDFAQDDIADLMIACRQRAEIILQSRHPEA